MSGQAKAGPKGRELTGVALADARHKTTRILIERRIKHPLFGKTLRRHKKLLVHDPEETCRRGDRVVVREARPISKHKAHVLVRRLGTEAPAVPEAAQ